MTQAALKKQLHKTIDKIDDNNILEAVYTILSSKNSSAIYEVSDEDMNIIEERRALYEAGKLKVYTAKEVKKKLLKGLKK